MMTASRGLGSRRKAASRASTSTPVVRSVGTVRTTAPRPAVTCWMPVKVTASITAGAPGSRNRRERMVSPCCAPLVINTCSARQSTPRARIAAAIHCRSGSCMGLYCRAREAIAAQHGVEAFAKGLHGQQLAGRQPAGKGDNIRRHRQLQQVAHHRALERRRFRAQHRLKGMPMPAIPVHRTTVKRRDRGQKFVSSDHRLSPFFRTTWQSCQTHP